MTPQITPGYWICPRCDSKDFYFAPRVVGQVGIGRGFEIGNVDMAGGLARGIEKDVSLCRACSERMKWIPEVRVFSKEEELRSARNFSLFYLIFGTPCLVIPFWFNSTIGWDWSSTVLFVIGLGFIISGIIGLLKKKKS